MVRAANSVHEGTFGVWLGGECRKVGDSGSSSVRECCCYDFIGTY